MSAIPEVKGFLLEEIQFCDKMMSQALWAVTKWEYQNKSHMAPTRKWGEVRVTIPREAQEAVANFLMERGSNGIIIEDEGAKEGFEIIKAYFPYPLMIDSQSISRYLEAIRKFFPGICPSDIKFRLMAEKDWMRRWRTFFKASRLGRRIVVKPPWISLKPMEMIVIDIEPSMAFGTGTHPTTRLCLRALEKALTGVYNLSPRGERTPRSVLDVGMGSGILSIAAAKLGARHVLGIDIDQRAINNARENIRINRLRGRIRMRKVTISQIGEVFDLIVANIDMKTISEMGGHLMGRVAKRGILILSGVLEGEVDQLRILFPEQSFTLLEVSHEDGWACVVLKRA